MKVFWFSGAAFALVNGSIAAAFIYNADRPILAISVMVGLAIPAATWFAEKGLQA